MRAQEIVSYCRLMLDDPHGDVHTNDAMLKHLNVVLRDISTRSRCLVGESYLFAAPGQARYGLPADFLRLEYAGWQVGGGKYRPLSPTTFDIASWAAFNAKTGTPCYYDIFGHAAVERIVSVVEESSVVSRAVARVAGPLRQTPVVVNQQSALRKVSVTRAEEVFARYRGVLLREDLKPWVILLLNSLEIPGVQAFLTSAEFRVLREDPAATKRLIDAFLGAGEEAILALVPADVRTEIEAIGGIDEGLVDVIEALLPLWNDPQVQEVLKDPNAGLELQALIENPPASPVSPVEPAAPVSPAEPESPAEPVYASPPATAIPPNIDVDEQWVKLRGEHVEGIKRGDRIVNTSDGSAEGRVLEARNVLNSQNAVEQIILYTEITGGTRDFLIVGDEIRIISPDASRQSLIVSPVPTAVGDIGEEALKLFIARIHREITARDMLEENDTIELDPEFEPCLREYMLYYMMRADSNYEASDAQSQLVLASTLYSQALPHVRDRIRAWKRTWTRGPGPYVNPLGAWKSRYTAKYPIGSARQTY